MGSMMDRRDTFRVTFMTILEGSGRAGRRESGVWLKRRGTSKPKAKGTDLNRNFRAILRETTIRASLRLQQLPQVDLQHLFLLF